MNGYRKGSVRSADGTVIGYRQYGSGPALLLVHGGMLAAQHFTKLAVALSTDFTVCVPDRRGRGMSGPHGQDYGVLREVEDIRALATGTGATQAFGLSSGALILLRTALETPAAEASALERIALYEPPLSVNGSVPTWWLPRFDREIAAGRPASALVTAFKGMGNNPVFARIPRPVLAPLLALGARLQRGPAEDEVPIAELIPTQHYDLRIVAELADTAADYAVLDAEVLLLGGTKSAGYLTVALDELASVLPHARRVTLPGLGHDGPEDDGDPARVAEVLRGFFLR